MLKPIMILLLANFAVGTAGAQNMPASTFLSKAEALKKKGALALLSSDLRLLRKEMNASFAVLRAERLAAEKAGKKPAYCPPAKSEGVEPEEIIGHFRSIPEAQRPRVTAKDGFRSFLAKKFPCR